MGGAAAEAVVVLVPLVAPVVDLAAVGGKFNRQ